MRRASQLDTGSIPTQPPTTLIYILNTSREFCTQVGGQTEWDGLADLGGAHIVSASKLGAGRKCKWGLVLGIWRFGVLEIWRLGDNGGLEMLRYGDLGVLSSPGIEMLRSGDLGDLGILRFGDLRFGDLGIWLLVSRRVWETGSGRAWKFHR